MVFFKTTLKIALALILFCAVTILPSRPLFADADGYTFFVGDSSKNCSVVSTTPQTAALRRATLQKVSGESAFYKELDVENFINNLGATVLFTEELTDSVNYYCAAPLPYKITLYGQQVNLHICVKTDGVTVASPIIFGGY